MSTMIKMFSIIIMMNLFIYLGMNFAITAEGEELQEVNEFRLSGDLMQQLLDDSLNPAISSTKDNFTDYDINVNSSFTTFPESQGGEETGVGGISFFDVARMIIPFAKTLANIAISPITLFMGYRLPMLFVAIIGIPYLLIFFITVIAFLRGVPD